MPCSGPEIAALERVEIARSSWPGRRPPISIPLAAVKAGRGSDCEELTQGTHFRVVPNNRHWCGREKTPFAFLVPQKSLSGFGKKIADGGPRSRTADPETVAGWS